MNTLLTLEEFSKLPGDDRPSELVKGRVVQSPYLTLRHGLICSQIGYVLFRFLEVHQLGQVLGSITGVITEHDPDTVRGADVAFYSYVRVPKGPLPNEWLSIAGTHL